jgi:glycosyltransferase involved in cell wall biosynthesis
MPVRNEAAFIERSLGAVLSQDYPQDRFEVIVADGMSTDGTRELLFGLQQRHRQLKVVDNPGRIVSTGLNRAFPVAVGEIVVRIDGHCEIASDYITRCVAHLSSGAVSAVGGPIHTIGETHAASVIAVAMSSPFGVGGSAFRTITSGTRFTDTIPFPAYARQIIERAGQYDEELVRNQDDEYNYRLREIGVKLLFASDVRSKYYSRSSLRSLWRQYFQYGFWKVRVMQKHPRQMQARQFVPAAFVAALGLSVVAIPLLDAGWWLLSLVVGAYLLANLGATMGAIRRHGWRMLPLLPIVYGTLHLSYGAGFWTGVVRFWRGWGGGRQWSSAPST